ncbi:hypothetical protein N867_04435 [Actinotalea fermentans ATCC 43279 = JCM 9966 = DSM 3133]|uniref:MFS transporter n=1 Tax=Actinotalea fermentans TaxID=43671 RepID=A0A511YVN4_9CELL|nr:hypothetical protein N867_04435 [Actinotalea fermentans ATCC 43279 = JCM 9966 = DSM 3133]GEN79253.1 MFS transporter [Actinotalea fermentans]
MVWGAAVVAYAVAVLHRASLGVAGPQAVERFDVGAAVLSTFVVVQLAVYAGLQVPVGVLLDRFGSRALIAGGAAVMGTGQVLLGVAGDLPTAYVARVLIGAGDAATFISVVRLVALWFPARRVPLFTQLTGMAGHLGQLTASVPLVAVLQHQTWEHTFVGLGAVGALAALLAWAVVRDGPDAGSAAGGTLRASLRGAVTTSGTWLGFWSHALGTFPLAVFLLLWGFPFLVAQGLSASAAGGLMSLAVVAAVVTGPVIGVLTGRHPLRRSWMVLAVGVAVALAWAAVLSHPGRSPVWLLAVLVVVIGIGGPTSAIGFDYARTFNPSGRLGTASGLVNVGGFSTAVVSVLAVGVVLDLVADGRQWSVDDFRVAFAVQAVPWLVCVGGVLVTRRRTRRTMAEDGVVVPPVREVVARRRARP